MLSRIKPIKKDACILRVTPIKLPLGKDRGKEQSVPIGTTSLGSPPVQDRNNDVHLTLEQKRAARERKKKA